MCEADDRDESGLKRFEVSVDVGCSCGEADDRDESGLKHNVAMDVKKIFLSEADDRDESGLKLPILHGPLAGFE